MRERAKDVVFSNNNFLIALEGFGLVPFVLKQEE